MADHFAIYRVEKITQGGSLAASARHMARMRPTPNADPGRRARNRVLVGTEDPEADVRALLPELGARTEDGRLRRRSNSVLAIEVLLTASPEWWSSSTPEQRRDWLERSTEFLVETYGRENIAHLALHQDERTPHLTGFVVPLDEGCLNARRWTGGRGRLAAQQTAYAAAVAPLGLVRGVEGSPAKHERVKRHYGALAQPVGEIEVETPPRVLLNPAAWAAEQTRKLAPAAARAAEAQSASSGAKRAEAGQKAAQGRAERAEAALNAAKDVAAQLRALPLPDVLDALGLTQDPDDPNQWRADGHRISLGQGAKAGKWFDHDAGRGRGGAIDLVSHVMGTDFKGSLAWLSDRFGPGAAAADVTAQEQTKAARTVAEAVQERPAFTPPALSAEHWPHVRRHLVEDRALPARYVDKLHERNDLYADARRNAVFVCRDENGTVTGAELKGTVQRSDGSRFTGLAPGSRKELGGFRIGNVAKATAVYLVESAIDAISLAKLRAKDGEKNFAVISTAGTTPKPRSWFKGVAAHVRRVCAFDADDAGDTAAKKLSRRGWERLRPAAGDWNDELRARRDAASGAGAVGEPFPTPPDPDEPGAP
jgi:hypothetical protein